MEKAEISQKAPKPLWESGAWLRAWERTARIVEEIEAIAFIKGITDDDPLSIAREVASGNEEAVTVLLDDARTALFELLVERGHISVTESQWDDNKKGFHSGGILLRDISINGLANPRLDDAEYLRRTIELNVELMIEELYLEKGENLEDKAMVWISPYAHDMDNNTARQFGYKPETKRYMLRWIEIDRSGRRTNKQLFMKGSDPRRISAAMRRLGLSWDGGGLAANGILAAPFLVDKRNISSVIEVARIIDNGESFLGGEAKAGVSYDNLELVSETNELLFESYAKTLSKAMIDIAAEQKSGLISAAEALHRYRQQAISLADEIAANYPELARESIGDVAADLYLAAKTAAAQGETRVAQEYALRARAESNDAYMCGMVVKREDFAELAGLLKSQKGCVEFEVGQSVVCPKCRRRQVVLRRNLTPKRLYCAYSNCELALKGAKRQT